MAKDTKPGSALISAIKSESVVELGKEYAELGIDALLESKALESIPFVNTVVGMYKVAGHVRDQIFTDKFVRFLTPLSDMPEAERIEMAERLNEDDKFAGKAGARLIEIIDRMESENKPELAANFIKAFARKEVSFETLRHLLFALERIPAFDVDELALFSSRSGAETRTNGDPLLVGFVGAGLGINNGATDGGYIVPTKLCRIFVEAGLLKVKKEENDLEKFFDNI